MMTYRMLVLTDHLTHSPENSLYELVQALQQNALPATRRYREHKPHKAAYIPPSAQASGASLFVASRSTPGNRRFFREQKGNHVWATPVHPGFAYSPGGQAYRGRQQRLCLQDFDVILLRLPPPADISFLRYLSSIFPPQRIINRPDGIIRTSSKKFLLTLPDLCPPMALCETLDDIDQFRRRHPIVLKPLDAYGGQGLIRIEGDTVWHQHQPQSFRIFARTFLQHPVAYLGMRYLSRVGEGDKRIIVCNGRIVGASLRLPAHGSWLCNAAQGGISVAAKPDARERYIARRLTCRLQQEGVVLFGFDTLTQDNGLRVLSEINTMSIGGLKQMHAQQERPILQHTAQLIWTYVKNEIYGTRTINR